MINLYFSNGRAFVWNAEDWMKLRTNHRIIGELIGTIASFPRHAGFQGFPMALMSEEAALLIEEGHCKVVESTGLQKSPSDDIIALAEQTNERLYSQQLECMREKRIDQITSRIDIIISGKKKKLSNQGMIPECNRENMIQEEIQKIQPPSAGSILVQIPTEHSWPQDLKILDIANLEPSVFSDEGKIRYAVYKDLWKKGHYITSGAKFGGDFLVYPGDPVKFHAMYILKCLKNQDERLNLANLVAFGRLGVAVNKLTVLAYLDSELKVCYQTLQWHETLY